MPPNPFQRNRKNEPREYQAQSKQDERAAFERQRRQKQAAAKENRQRARAQSDYERRLGRLLLDDTMDSYEFIKKFEQLREELRPQVRERERLIDQLWQAPAEAWEDIVLRREEERRREFQREHGAGFSPQGRTATGDFSRMYGMPIVERLSPAEIIRRRITPELPTDRQKTLATFERPLINGVIATVLESREADPERTDWNIHIAYRRAIEVESPDPAMVQKTQISGILLEGAGKEARYPF